MGLWANHGVNKFRKELIEKLSYRNRLSNKLMFYIIVIIYFIIPLFFKNSSYMLSTIINASILSCISLGIWLTFLINRVNIGQAAFVGIGGYTTAFLLTKLGLSFWICLPLAGIIAAFLSLILGFVLLRLKGVYFSMVTLTLTALMNIIFLYAAFITKGANGIMNIPRPGALSIGSFNIIRPFGKGDYIPFYYLVAFVLLICFIGIWRLNNSRIGQILQSLRQSETLAQSIGINIVKYRILAYMVCGFLGGIGGSLFVVYIQSIFPSTFQVNDSVYYMLYCFLGGLDYIFGPVIGAFLLTISFELLRSIQRFQVIIYAIIMIVVMLWFPNGILSLKFNRNIKIRKEIIDNLKTEN
jgi:branched-chain amino acid transport system permease protein